MKTTAAATAFAVALLPSTTYAFAPVSISSSSRCTTTAPLMGYLDDLTSELYEEVPEVNPELETLEATNLDRSSIDRHGVGSWDDYVEFDDFDGGDGQQGCVGDGNTGLAKFGDDVQAMIVQKSSADSQLKQGRANSSRGRSARVAWGSSTGYADKLRDQGVESSRAQQMENWANQRELYQKTKETERMTSMDEVTDHEEDWRMLSKFGAERVSDVNYDEAFGAVEVGGDLEGTIEIKSTMNRVESHSFFLKNPFMGFADFRAQLTADSHPDFSITPSEGALSKEPVEFTVKFRPSAPMLIAEGFLVIETEDFKKTWKLLGTTGV